MSVDEGLAARIRDLLSDSPDVSEQRMFGGIGFLLAGKMAVAASSRGGLLVRVRPDRIEQLLATTRAEPMEMRGRSIRGWLHVDIDDLATESQLEDWIAIGSQAARLS